MCNNSHIIELFGEITDENFPNQRKELDTKIQEAKNNKPKEIYFKTHTKMANIKDKENPKHSNRKVGNCVQ